MSDVFSLISSPSHNAHDLEIPIPTVNHGGGSIMLCACFSSAWTKKLISVEGEMDVAKCRVILEENLLSMGVKVCLPAGPLE